MTNILFLTVFVIYIGLMLHFLTSFLFCCFFFRCLTGQVKKQDFSVIKKMDPSLFASHFSILKEKSAAFSQFEVNTNSIKVTN